jgi:hypothetical protein
MCCKASPFFSSSQQPPLSARPLHSASHCPPPLQALATMPRLRAPPRHCPPQGPLWHRAGRLLCCRGRLPIDRRLRCSSGPVNPASSVARALRCSLTSPTKPTIAGRPPSPVHPSARPPSPPRARHGEPPPPFTPNRDHRRPGLLPGCFPADQRLPVCRNWPVGHRRRRGFPLPCFFGQGPKRPRELGHLAKQA